MVLLVWILVFLFGEWVDVYRVGGCGGGGKEDLSNSGSFSLFFGYRWVWGCLSFLLFGRIFVGWLVRSNSIFLGLWKNMRERVLCYRRS